MAAPALRNSPLAKLEIGLARTMSPVQPHAQHRVPAWNASLTGKCSSRSDFFFAMLVVLVEPEPATRRLLCLAVALDILRVIRELEPEFYRRRVDFYVFANNGFHPFDKDFDVQELVCISESIWGVWPCHTATCESPSPCLHLLPPINVSVC